MSIPQGWQCPVCHSVFSPQVSACSNCPPGGAGVLRETPPTRPNPVTVTQVVGKPDYWEHADRFGRYWISEPE